MSDAATVAVRDTGQDSRLSQVRERLINSVWKLLQPVELHHASNTESLVGGKNKHLNCC